MEKLRLALFTDTYAPEINGVAKTLERWVAYLRDQGHECLVFAPSRPRREKTMSETAERLSSLPFFLYPECRLAIPRSAEAERKLLKFKPNAIHVATPFGTGVVGRHLAIKHGIPLVASHHTHFARYLPYYNLQWLGKLLWRYLHWFHRPCRKIYVPSNSVLEECRSEGWARLEVWGRGVDAKRFRPHDNRAALRRELGLNPSTYVALYAGRIAPEKDPGVAVEAVSLLDRRGVDIAFVAAGDGPFSGELRELAASKGIQARFLGPIAQENLRLWMAASDVLLFPSATETFGNVVLEAMACGLPVVGAAGGAVPDTVKDGANGLLCPPGDSGAFAEALDRLRRGRAMRELLSEAGLRHARERSWDEVFRRLKESMEESVGVHSAAL
ncbi:glycosyltransferase family 4 protein [Cohnella suwonensis]|uniref:Glycosyltransferase family 4 protein n=1 Tax=Cohnella suwonensis TaxID=696072 RepID=A0ABW0M0R3_9BACL